MTTATSPLRVKSAQEAVDLLYNHFIKNRHRPAYDINEAKCFTMPVNACYPRCAVGILTRTSEIRKEAPLNHTGTKYCSNPGTALVALNALTPLPSFADSLRMAHDEAARHYHASWDFETGQENYDDHKSFRSAFAASLRSICARYNLEYPGDR